MPVILRMEPTLHATVRTAAHQAEVSLNQFIVNVLEEKLKAGTSVGSSVRNGPPMFAFRCPPALMEQAVRYASTHDAGDIDLVVANALRFFLENVSAGRVPLGLPATTIQMIEFLAETTPQTGEQLLTEMLWDGIAVRHMARERLQGRALDAMPPDHQLRRGFEHYCMIADAVRGPMPNEATDEPEAPETPEDDMAPPPAPTPATAIRVPRSEARRRKFNR